MLALLALFAAYFVFYFLHRGAPAFTYWDESIYINASRAYLSSTKPYPNPEHPLLGKQLLALGMKIFGDNPTGWRFFGILAGALTNVLACYLIWLLSQRWGVAVFVGILLFFDPLLFVHFRMGLLDPPLAAFLMLSAALACRWSLSERPTVAGLLPVAVALGLALSVKLLTLFIIPLVIGLVAYRLYREPARRRDILPAVLLLGMLPPALLILDYLLQGYDFSEAFELIVFNFKWHSTAKSMEVLTSRWYEWLYIGNPLWYYQKPLEGGRFQAMLATGNLILWVGAELLALYAVIRRRRQAEVIFLALIILAQFGIYFRKPHTYIHYMTEIVPFLFVLMGVGIGDLFDRYEDRYRRILHVDLGIFAAISFLAFWNYWPYVSGQDMTREQFNKVSHVPVAAPVKPTAAPSPLPASPKPTPTP